MLIPIKRNEESRDYEYIYLIGINTSEPMDGEINRSEENNDKIRIDEIGYGKVVWRRKKK